MRMLELLTEKSPYGAKPTDVVTFLVSRELDLIHDKNRFKIRDLIEDSL